jgi:hypothetical protein
LRRAVTSRHLSRKNQDRIRRQNKLRRVLEAVHRLAIG